MGVSASVYSRPAKFSTIIADADLDIGARAILTTDLSLYQGSTSEWDIKNRSKLNYRYVKAGIFIASMRHQGDILQEATTGAGVTVDGLLIKDDKILEPGSLNEPQTYAKVASNNNRHAHSYDGNRAPDASAAAKVAGMVFTNGLVGTVRVEVSISSSNATAEGNAMFKVDGVQKGITKDSGGLVHNNYNITTQDIALDIPAGGELELWLWNDNDVHTVYAKDWKIDYDNAADAIAVGQTEA